MNLSRDYRRPFWHGFFHAVLVVAYLLFISLVILQIEGLYQGRVGEVVRTTFNLFLVVLSVAMCAWLIFYEPLKKLLKFHFRAASVMLISTLGWLFTFMIIFLVMLSVTIS